MSDAPNKHRVAQRFHHAASDYDALAHIQRQAAERLAYHLSDRASPGLWLDAGCGTGEAITRHLRAPVIALDFAPAMAQKARDKGAPALCGDIESLPLEDASIALYWSSLAWQWCHLEKALSEAHRVLTPSGHLLINTLGPATLSELRAAFGSIDDARHVIDFTQAPSLAEAAREAGFEDIALATHLLTAWHPDVATLLRQLKQLGAAEVGNHRRRGLLGKRAWQTVIQHYERHRTPQGLPASYEVILLTARKKS
ncbi:MAG: hypothetical protein RIR70_966 [Pseudomonadota bacterium]|jgi:malonyl-CoA O-methyltransferase